MGLFDVHAHLTHPEIAPRLGDVLAAARAAGVTSIVTNGLHPADNEAVMELASREPLVRPAFGLYPVDAVLGRMVELGIDYPREAEPCTPEEGIAWVGAHAAEAFALPLAD